jgi:type IV secretion system protein TrbL
MTQEIAFVDGIVQAAREMLSQGADGLHSSVQGMLELAVIVTVRTPHPESQDGFFFGEPTNEPWVSIYGYYTDVVLPVTVLVIALAIALILFTGIFGRFLTGYERSRAKRRLVVAFLFVLVWWAVGAFTLRFVDALAGSIAPDPSVAASTFEDTMTLQGHGTTTTAALTILEALIMTFLIIWFFVRWLGIYALMLATPIGVAFWVVDVGPFSYLSSLIEGVLVKFIPLAFVAVPAAVVFRVGELLFANFDPATEFGSGLGPFLFALGFPLVILVVSYYMFRAPTLGRLREAAPAEAAADRQAVEKGRGAPEEGEEVSRTADLYKRGEDSASEGDEKGTGAVEERRPLRGTDLPTRGGAPGRSTTTYSAGGSGGSGAGAGMKDTSRDISRSRRKMTDGDRRWA